jgi:hypothetical protein
MWIVNDEIIMVVAFFIFLGSGNEGLWGEWEVRNESEEDCFFGFYLRLVLVVVWVVNSLALEVR